MVPHPEHMCSAEEGPAGELIQVIAEERPSSHVSRGEEDQGHHRTRPGHVLFTSSVAQVPLRTTRCRSVVCYVFVVIHQQLVSVSMAMPPGRGCFHREPSNMAAVNLETAARTSSQEK